jgi:integrase
MQGHIRKRDGSSTWTVTYEVGKQPAQRCAACDSRFWVDRRPLDACPKCGGELVNTTERRQKTKGGFIRRKGKNPATDAEAFLHQTSESMSRGTYVEPRNLTLGDYLDGWVKGLRNSKLRPTTVVSYEVHVVHHLTPRLGATPLQNLNRQRIAAHYAWLSENGRVPRRKPKEEKKAEVKLDKNGNPKRPRKKRSDAKEKPVPVVKTALSPTTVRRVHATLHRALRDAVRDNLIPRNYADDVEFPDAVKQDRVLHAWDSSQLKTFLTSTDGDRLRPLWLLYATTGARRGELLGLTWEDVDLTAGTITIRRALVPIGYTVAVSEPKTESGRRTIAVPASVCAVLKRHKATQKAEKMAHRDVWGKDRPEGLGQLNLVFTNEVGRELHPDRVSKLFEQAVTKSKQPRISLHGLRHTFATIALMEGKQPVSVVSRRLGHSKTSVTLDFYAHAMPRDDEQASNAVAALVVPEGF